MAQQIFETVGIEFHIGEGGEHRLAGEAVGFRVGDIDLSTGIPEVLPGVMAVSILFGTTSMLAVTITFEKKNRSFERLLLAPLFGVRCPFAHLCSQDTDQDRGCLIDFYRLLFLPYRFSGMPGID